ncbi:16731_t:CDS:2, partial [Racocetra persica]
TARLRRIQIDYQRYVMLTGWEHYALLVMKVKSIEYQIGFEEFVHNACEHDDTKWSRIEKKFLAMQLGLFRLRQALREYRANKNDFNNAEMLEILVY